MVELANVLNQGSQVTFPSSGREPAPTPQVFARTGASVGSVVDSRYRLLREIACGGGGVVFEAEHVHTRARVAVKTLSYALLGRGGGHRVLREARSLGRLRHPNIVPVLDAGECRKHGPFVVLALIDGRTLQSFISGRARLDVASSVALACQIGNALWMLGRRGVIHRDVKPSNVLITRGDRGAQDTAILIDFGVARLQDEPVSDRLTLDGDLVGTPEYMAPEQLSGSNPLDHRTDVYGLGALIYECLTGSPPYTGHPLAVVSSITLGAKPPPISQSRGDVPPALEAAVLRALERDPGARWPDTAAFARACVAAMNGALEPLSLYSRHFEQFESRRPPAAHRKSPRAPYQAPARILVGPHAGYDARVEDISSGGLLLATAAQLDTETHVAVRFPLPMSGRVITLEASVRWSRMRGNTHVVGVEFVRASAEVRREIDSFTAHAA